ncbi:RNA polymerase II mediator complex subunit [Rhizina undulata]
MEHTSGSDIQEPLLAFLDSLRTNFVGNRDDFYLLVSELVRSKTFSIASYMKWLIARGAMSQFSSLDKDHPCHVRLLAEVPVYNAPSYIRNLRSILLRKTNFFTEHELETSKAMQGLLKDLFEQRSETGERGGVLTFEETQQLRSLSRAVMAELALWIRDHYVRVHVVKGQPVGRDNWRDLSVDVGTTTISTRQFCLIRGVLEDFRDYVVLADVVKMVASSSVSTTLAAVADTISYNIEIFSALGVAGSLLQLLHARYKKLRTRRTIEKFLVVSLVELASLPELDEAIRDELQNDLATYDKRYPRASMANSPISDSMGADSSEEIDQLAMNGAGIDRQHLSRLFETTASKMETSFEETGAQRQLSSLASHLVKLRQLDASSFDDLMKGWITRLFHLSSRPSLSQTLATLMTALCLDFELLVKVTLGAIKANPMKLSNVAATEIAAQTLELLVGDGSFEGSFSPEELYGLKRKRKQFQLRHTSIFVQLVTRSIQVCVSTGSEELSRRIERLATSQFSLRLLRSAASMQPDLLNSDLVEPLSKPRNMALSRWLGIIIDNLLDDHDSSDLADTDPEVQVTHLLHLANDFSIGLCQLKIRIIFDRQKKSPSITVGESTLVGSNPVTKAFFRGIANSFEDRINIWCDLVTVLSPECACQIRMYAEELFLQSPTFPRVQLPTDPMEPRISDYQGNGETLAKALLSLIDATAGSIPLAGIPSYSSLLVNRLHALVHSMTNPDEDGDKEDGGMEIGWSESFSELRCWLLLLLRIVILHRNAFFSNGKSGDSARMVVGLYALLQLEQIQNDPELFDFVFDVACSFVDELTEDSRQQIRRFTKGRTQPPRMTYLTGGMEQTEDWLRATQRGKLIEYPMKPWERLAEPTPIIGENDTSLSLVLFRTRKVRCARSH